MATLLAQALAAQEKERRAVTRVLQEDIGQALTALAVRLQVVENGCDNPQCLTLISEARAIVADVLRHTERLTHRLYPPALESQGLGPALEVYAQDFAHLTHLQVELDLEVLPSRLPTDVEVALFRIVQEALEGSRRYACASAVRIVLRRLEGHIYMALQDDGIGYPADVLSDWCLLRMSQRAEALGGSCTFSMASGQGAHIEVIIPVECEEDR